jgi:hypothetical protein
MQSPFSDQLEQVGERVLGRARDDAGEIGRPACERLGDRQIERGVRAKANERLARKRDGVERRFWKVLPDDGPEAERTMTSTVSYRLTTRPSPSTIGTALIPRSENMWTTSKTVVSSVAVASGQWGEMGPRGRR